MSLVLRTTGSRLGLSLTLAAVTVLSTAPAVSATAAAPPPPPTPAIQWTDCADDINKVFDCAQVPVPLDYDEPSGPVISLALIRLPAGDPAHRKGSLFINPGGPGGSGVIDVRNNAQQYPAAVRDTFDIIGFDPRGIGNSTTFRCFRTNEEAQTAQEAREAIIFPITEPEVRDWEAADQLLTDSCAANAGPIMNHMSTANVARDLDQLRRSVGDRNLNFIGFSYGSYLGTTYANMFPRTVGALVVDGVLDPIAWSTGSGQQSKRLPFTTRIRSDAGSERTLKQFFTLCDLAEDNCAFAPHSRARYEALLVRLKTNPIELFPGYLLGDRALLAQTSGALYLPTNWPYYAQILAGYEATPTAPATAPEPMTSSLTAPANSADGTATYTPWESVFAVACLDTDNPPTYAAWSRTANVMARRYPHFGRLWAWENSSACQSWPGTDSDRYIGPWNKKTANPVLVVGNYYDPSTRYEGAVTVSRLLPGARLLSYAGWGHKTSIIAGNDCMQNAITQYLVANELPPRGTVCQPTGSPFDTQPEDSATLPLTPLEIPDHPSWTTPGN